MLQGINWNIVKIAAVVIGCVSASLALLETTGTRWWIWKFEYHAYAEEVADKFTTVAEAQSVLDRRLKAVEQSALTRDLVSIKIQLRELRAKPGFNGDDMLQQLEQQLERELLETERALDRLKS